MSTPTTNTRELSRITKARRKHLRLQDASSSTAVAELTAPDVQGIVDRADGTLHKDRLKADLKVEIPAWPYLPPGDDPNDYVTLQLQFTLTGAEDSFRAIGPLRKFEPPIKPEHFPLELFFPQASIPRNGKLWIRYQLEDHIPDTYVSLPIELICDSVAPWGDNPVPPLEGPEGIINENYLIDHIDGIEFTIPTYTDRAPGDTYQAFYVKEWPDEDAIYDNPVALGPVTDDMKITIPAANVRALGDGRFYAIYYLFDKAQNRSRIRVPATVDVVLTPEPTRLLPPKVPAADDGVVSLADAQAGVHVEIHRYGNPRSEDRIAIKWGLTPLTVEQVGSRTFPISIPVPNDVLRKEYGQATGVVPTNVSYEILRGFAPYGPAADNFGVDFSIVGPVRPDPDPDWPDPVNSKLGAPVIYGSTRRPNEILPEDRDEDATLEFEIFEGAANGQIVEFYWGGTEVVEARWIVDLTSNTSKSVTIPWSYIQKAGNNLALPVHYTVRASDGINKQESITQYVVVSAIDMTPDDLEFLGVSTRGWLSCPSIWDPANPSADPAIRVQVPPCSRLDITPGTVMTLTWVVYDATIDGNLIPGVKKEESVTLTAEQIDNGFVWRVEPYAKHIQPIYEAASLGGRAQVSYVIEADDDFSSKPTSNRISIADQGTGGSCDLTRP